MRVSTEQITQVSACHLLVLFDSNKHCLQHHYFLCQHLEFFCSLLSLELQGVIATTQVLKLTSFSSKL